MTPSPQSVVPVEPTDEMLSAAKPWPKHWPKYEDASESARVAFNVDRAVVKSQWRDMLAAAPAPSSLAGGALDPQSVTLEWVKVETGALEEWRAEFGDYVALVTLGHDNVWAHRVNNSGRLHYKTADEAKAAALADLQGRLSIRLHAARKTVALYDAALSPEAPARSGAEEALASAERVVAAAFVYEDNELFADSQTVLAALRARSSAPEARS